MQQLDKISDSVYKATISGNLKWELDESIFNNDTTHKYLAKSTDGKTKFVCRVRLSKDLKTVEKYADLDVSNNDIVDGSVHIKNDTVTNLHQWIYDNHIKKGLMSKNQDIVYEDILKSIDVSEYRDSKINEVLESSEKKESVEKKGLFNKIFGK